MTRILVFLLLVLSFSNYAQQFQVKDVSRNKSIPGALFFKNGEVKAVSDSLGMIKGFCFEKGDSLSVGHYKSYVFDFSCKSTPQRVIYLEPRFVALSEVNYSVNFLGEENEKESFQISLLNEEHLEQNPSGNSADLLSSKGMVNVQKTQQGGGSPIIRGFEANRVLIMIDGVRMNNAIYRSNHLQNVMTLDASSIERVEVLYGPASSIYGSDALGGVMSFYTKDIQYSVNDSIYTQLNYGLSYSSVDDSRLLNVGFSMAADKYKTHTSVSRKEFGDLNIGQNRWGQSDTIGLINYYPLMINSIDSFAVNDNPSVLKLGAYSQTDILHKQSYLLNEKLEANVNFQYSNSSNINRLDRLYEFREGQPRFSEWYYGPQERLLTAFTLNGKGKYSSQHIVAYQNVKESRHTRLYQDSLLNSTNEDVDVYSLSGKYLKDSTKIGNIQFGYDGQFNVVGSEAFSTSVNTASRYDLQTRYPSEGSELFTGGTFFMLRKPMKEGVLFNAGLRLNINHLNADFGEDNVMQLTQSKYTQTNVAPTFNFSWKKISKVWNYGFMISSGYKTPNVDDFGKVFVKKGVVVVPNVQLKPEYAYNLDLSLKRKWKKASLESVAYFAFVDNMIVEDDFTINGQDSLFLEGEMSKVRVNVNINSGWISGISIQFKQEINEKVTWYSNHNFQIGRQIENEIFLSSQSLSHISPYFGKTGLLYEYRKFKVWPSVSYNGTKRFEFLSEKEQGDMLYEGQDYRAFILFNLGLSYELWEGFEGQLNLNNITDQYYLPFTSDISGAGRNLMINVKGRF